MLKLTFYFYLSMDCMRKLKSCCSLGRRLPVTLLFNIVLTNYIALNIFLQVMDLSPIKIGRKQLMQPKGKKIKPFQISSAKELLRKFQKKNWRIQQVGFLPCRPGRNDG